MFLGADIEAKGPKLKDGELHIENEKDGVEFDLITKEAKQPGMGRFSVWVRSCEEDVTIVNECMDDMIHDSFYFEIQDKKENSVALTLSVKQAMALKQILEHYLDAFYALQALKKEKRVDRI